MFALTAMHRLGGKNLRISKPIIENENDFNTYLTWESDEEITWTTFQEMNSIVAHEAGLRKVRKQRDRLLAESDWIVSTVDNGVANKEEWIAYRQALRDLPQQAFHIVWVGIAKIDMSSVPFPTKPQVIRSTNSSSPPQ